MNRDDDDVKSSVLISNRIDEPVIYSRDGTDHRRHVLELKYLQIQLVFELYVEASTCLSAPPHMIRCTGLKWTRDPSNGLLLLNNWHLSTPVKDEACAACIIEAPLLGDVAGREVHIQAPYKL